MTSIRDAFNFNRGEFVAPIPERDVIDTNQKKNDLSQVLGFYQQFGNKLFQGMSPLTNDMQNAVGQAMSILNPKAAQTQAQGSAIKQAAQARQGQQSSTPSPEPTPTPFGKNMLDGYVMRTPKQYTSMIDASAKANNVPSSLLSALLARESMGFRPDVISGNMNSPKGAQGIAQFMPETAKGMGINPLDPQQAIMGAGKLLRAHYEKYNNRPDLALAAYNSGSGNVDDFLNGTNYTGNNPKNIKTPNGIPPFDETQGYVKGIMDEAKTTYTNTGN